MPLEAMRVQRTATVSKQRKSINCTYFDFHNFPGVYALEISCAWHPHLMYLYHYSEISLSLFRL